MVVRVDIQGLMEASSGATPKSGVQVYEDGTRPLPWQPRPFSSRSDFNTSEALELMALSADSIREIRPPFPLGHVPEIVGYDHTPLTIEEVLDTERWSPTQRSFMSGAVKPRHADAQEDMWSGTARNFGGGQGEM